MATIRQIMATGTTRCGATHEWHLSVFCRQCGNNHNCACCNWRKRIAAEERRAYRAEMHEIAAEAVAAGDCVWADCCVTGKCTRPAAVPQ